MFEPKTGYGPLDMWLATVLDVAVMTRDVGVVGHGLAGDELAERYAAAVRAWDRQARPRLTVTREPPAVASGVTHRSVRRVFSTLTISWA